MMWLLVLGVVDKDFVFTLWVSTQETHGAYICTRCLCTLELLSLGVIGTTCTFWTHWLIREGWVGVGFSLSKFCLTRDWVSFWFVVFIFFYFCVSRRQASCALLTFESRSDRRGAMSSFYILGNVIRYSGRGWSLTNRKLQWVAAWAPFLGGDQPVNATPESSNRPLTTCIPNHHQLDKGPNLGSLEKLKFFYTKYPYEVLGELVRLHHPTENFWNRPIRGLYHARQADRSMSWKSYWNGSSVYYAHLLNEIDVWGIFFCVIIVIGLIKVSRGSRNLLKLFVDWLLAQVQKLYFLKMKIDKKKTWFFFCRNNYINVFVLM